jgi:hypothetical protein
VAASGASSASALAQQAAATATSITSGATAQQQQAAVAASAAAGAVSIAQQEAAAAAGTQLAATVVAAQQQATLTSGAAAVAAAAATKAATVAQQQATAAAAAVSGASTAVAAAQTAMAAANAQLAAAQTASAAGTSGASTALAAAMKAVTAATAQQASANQLQTQANTLQQQALVAASGASGAAAAADAAAATAQAQQNIAIASANASAAKYTYASSAKYIGDSGSKYVGDSKAQYVGDSKAQDLQDSAAQDLQDSGSHFLGDSGAKFQQFSGAQSIRDSRAQFIGDSRAQFVGDSRAVYWNNSGASFTGYSGAQYGRDSKAQFVGDSRAQFLGDSRAIYQQDSSAQSLQDSAAHDIQSSGAQEINDSAAQFKQDSGADFQQNSGAQLLQDSGAQDIQDSGAQFLGDSRAVYDTASSAQYLADSGAQIIQDSGSRFLNESAAFVSGAVIISHLGNDPPSGRFVLPKRTQMFTKSMTQSGGGKPAKTLQSGGGAEPPLSPSTTDDLTILTNGYEGRYIRVRPPFYEGDGFMTISQIIIYDVIGLNLAPNAKIYATSSLDGTSPPKITIDGTTTIRDIPNVWHSATPNRDTEYIELDLGENHEIYAVRVLGTKTCPFGNPRCHARLDYTRIEIRRDGDSGISQDAIDTYENQVLDEQAALAHAFIVKSLDKPSGSQITLQAQPDVGNDPSNGSFTLTTTDFDQTIKVNEFLGRYVRLRPSLTNGDGFINLSQVIVYDVLGQNISEGKATYATSSISGTKPSSIIVDGNTTVRTIPDVWHSNSRNREKEFIEIDLGSNQTIVGIRVIGRKGCPLPNMCENRMLGLRVEIRDTTTEEAVRAYHSRPPDRHTDLSGQKIRVRTLANNASSIKLRHKQKDPSIPAGYTKIWSSGKRRYEYKDTHGKVVLNPAPPSLRNPSKVFQVLSTDIQILTDPTITPPWTKYFDTINRKYYYQNTNTLENTWDHPFSPRMPVEGETRYGDDGLPETWEKYLDSALQTYFYYKPSTGELSWDHPHPPPYPDGLAAIANKYLPLYEMYRDPTTHALYYFNTLTTETVWTLPIGIRKA